MKKFGLIGAVAALFFCTTAANAGVMQTITLSGVLGNSWDGTPLFRATAGDLVGSTYALSLTYDTSLLTGDTCSGIATSCQWNLGAGSTETVVINNTITKMFTIASGTIAFNINGGADSIQINTNNARINASLYDSTSLFSSQSNTNSVTALASVSNMLLSGGSHMGSGVGSGTTLDSGSNAVYITTSRSTTAVPEPLTLGIFGAGLAGTAALRRRRRNN